MPSPTRETLDRFLELLAQGHTIVHACAESKLPRQTAYNRRDKDEYFAIEWERALEAGIQVLEQEARRRAVDGVDEPIVYQGVVTDTVRKFSDTLLIFLLKAKRPAVYRDNVRTEISGPDSGPIVVANDVNADRAEAILNELEARGLIAGSSSNGHTEADEVHTP